VATTLHVVAVNARCASSDDAALSCLFLAIVVDVLDVEGVDVTRDVPQYRQADVDEEIHSTTSDSIDADRGDEDSDEDEKDCGDGTHFDGLKCSVRVDVLRG